MAEQTEKKVKNRKAGKTMATKKMEIILREVGQSPAKQEYKISYDIYTFDSNNNIEPNVNVKISCQNKDLHVTTGSNGFVKSSINIPWENNVGQKRQIIARRKDCYATIFAETDFLPIPEFASEADRIAMRKKEKAKTNNMQKHIIGTYVFGAFLLFMLFFSPVIVNLIFLAIAIFFIIDDLKEIKNREWSKIDAMALISFIISIPIIYALIFNSEIFIRSLVMGVIIFMIVDPLSFWREEIYDKRYYVNTEKGGVYEKSISNSHPLWLVLLSVYLMVLYIVLLLTKIITSPYIWLTSTTVDVSSLNDNLVNINRLNEQSYLYLFTYLNPIYIWNSIVPPFSIIGCLEGIILWGTLALLLVGRNGFGEVANWWRGDASINSGFLKEMKEKGSVTFEGLLAFKEIADLLRWLFKKIRRR
ncbi:MAG: hypothetical protein Q8Q23_02620 [bacterium]|nr:hypothetical protein [bacterium]